jgi:NAD(P)-dependent dehydrogenase (short-subunit alcohol dehydrogenase family)
MRTALVTGGNRGLGLEVARTLRAQGLAVWLGSRELADGEAAAAQLGARAVQLELRSQASIDAALRTLDASGAQIDVLVNNAGVFVEGQGLLSGDERLLREAFEVHVFGPLRLARALAPAMLRRGYGRIVNVSSGLGSLSEGLNGPGPYSVTKACLNAVTLKLVDELLGDVKVNSVDPGWVATRMGGRGAPRTVQQGADTIVWLATLPDDGPTGGFFRDRAPIAW